MTDILTPLLTGSGGKRTERFCCKRELGQYFGLQPAGTVMD